MYFGSASLSACAMIPGVSRSGRQHRRGDAAGGGQARGGGVFFLPGDSDHGWGLCLRPVQNRADMTTDHLASSAIGFVVSFIVAMIVVKTFLNYLTRHGFTLFAWWRVIVGTLGLVALAMGR